MFLLLFNGRVQPFFVNSDQPQTTIDMYRYRHFIVLSILLSLVCSNAASQPTIRYKAVISSLRNPLDIVNAGDGTGRLFVVQKEGIVNVYDSAYQLLGEFLRVSVSTQSERGLLSLAFHPDYKSNGFFFTYSTNNIGDIEISRFKISSDPNKADLSSRLIIMTIPHRDFANHNGGKMNFGPDGYLYFATGDGGGAGDPNRNGQNGASLLGKMIRIDINKPGSNQNYSIPADNPFINDSTISDEIWALGLRNPWRWSFDRLTGDLWIGDVGQNGREEINARKAGSHKGLNYGWRCYEGTRVYVGTGCLPGSHYTAPIFDYPRNNVDGGWSVTGGYVYRGKEYPVLNGYYVFADYVSGNQWIITDSMNTWVVTQLNGNFPKNIAGFGEGEDGTIYACSLSEGVVYKLEAPSGLAYQLLEFSGKSSNGNVDLNWKTREQNIKQYEVERSLDSLVFQQVGIVTAKNQPGDNIYQFSESVSTAIPQYYRLRIVSEDGKWDYSNTITVRETAVTPAPSFIHPTLISDGVINCYLPSAFEILEVFDASGSLVLQKDIRGASGKVQIAIPHFARGLYFVRITRGGDKVLQRILVQ